MLVDAAGATYTGEAMRFCRTASCPVVYFDAKGERSYMVDDLRVRAFQKSGDPDRLVCYCFRHTVRAVQDDADPDGRSSIAEAITRRCRAGEDDCERTNPQGACCLGNVRRVAKRAQQGDGDQGGGCCGPRQNGERTPSPRAMTEAGAGRTARVGSTIGALLAAILASACCWLPLALVGAGASVAGVANIFESLRPYLLALTGLMLGLGFFFTYRRREARERSGQYMEAVSRRASRVGIWLATALALVFVFIPDIIESATADRTSPAESNTAEVRTYSISGMTCAGCTAHVHDVIAGIEAVESVRVSYGAGVATVRLGSPVDDDAIIRAIASLGYQGRRAGRDADLPRNQ